MKYTIQIENYRSIINTKIELKSGLNILIGPNGAGKTCILSSLKFLRDILLNGAALAVAKAGGASRVYHRGTSKMRFEVQFSIQDKIYNKRTKKTWAKWSIELEQNGPENVAAITAENIEIYSGLENSEIATLLSIDINRKRIDHPKISISINENAGKDLLSRYSTFYSTLSKDKLYTRIKESFKESIPNLKQYYDRSVLWFLSQNDYDFESLESFLLNLSEYNIIPERARQSTEQLPYATMSPNGFGVSEVLDALMKKNYHRLRMTKSNDTEYENSYYMFNRFNRNIYYRQNRFQSNYQNAWENINKDLASAVKPITNVSVQIDPTNGKRFVVFKSDNHQFYPDEVSDGTIKWLCILTSIHVGFSYIYLLEEPENFLHPWMQQKLVQIMRDSSKKSHAIYLLTTHSTTVLNAAYPDELIIVKPTDNGTTAERINNKNELQDLLDNSEFRLGDLWVSGGIGAIPE